MLARKQTRVRNNGCLKYLPDYQHGNQVVYVDAQSWSEPERRRAVHENSFNPLEMRQFVTRAASTVPASWNNSEITNKTYVRPSLPVPRSSTVQTYITSEESSPSVTAKLTGIVIGTSTQHNSTVTNRTAESKVNQSSLTPPSINLGTDLPPASSGSTMSIKSDPSAMFGPNTSFVGATSSVRFPRSSSSQQVGMLSPSLGSTTIAENPFLATSFSQQSPTVTPAAFPLLCPAYPSCAKPTPSWLESIFSAPDLYIPKITDLGAVPTVKVKHNHEDQDSMAIVFARLEISKEKCNPLPKPKAGGLLGVVANVANKIVDTVMDAACNMEFPVLDSELPEWLDFTKFPGLKGYSVPPGAKPIDTANPVDPDEPDDSQEQTASATSKTSSSSSSSCSTKTLTNCQGTNIISGTATLTFATKCSTEAACSGSGITSMADSTMVPSPGPSMIVDPGESEQFLKEQDCFLDFLANAKGDIDYNALATCFGGSMGPSPASSGNETTTSGTSGNLNSTIADSIASSSSVFNHTVTATSGPHISANTNSDTSSSSISRILSINTGVPKTPPLTSLSTSQYTPSPSAPLTLSQAKISINDPGSTDIPSFQTSSPSPPPPLPPSPTPKPEPKICLPAVLARGYCPP
jgi:hypothetical protein